jgi:hypothetical protein
MKNNNQDIPPIVKIGKLITLFIYRLKPFLFFILSVAFVIFSLWPMFWEITQKDTIRPERRFELVHNFYTDFNFYLSRIRQGLEGNLTVHENYTSEPHQGSFIHVFYLALGWLGNWAKINWHRTSDIYHATRAVLGLVLLLITAEIAKRSFGKYKLAVLGFLLAVTASTWPVFVHMDDGSFRYGGYMPWWSVMDSLQRITFIPHLLAGQALLAFLIFAGSDLKTMSKPGNWIFLGVLGFVLGIIFPPGLVFVFATYAFVIFIEFIYDLPKPNKLKSWILVHLVPRVVLSLVACPSLAYLQLMVTFYPWKQLALADIEHPLPFKYWEYLQAVGMVLPFGIVGGLIALKNRDRNMIISLSWAGAWIALLIIFNWIPQQSPLRFSEMIVHVPLGLLTMYLFFQIYLLVTRIVNKIRRNKTSNSKLQLLPVLVYLFPMILLVSNLFHMYSSWLWQRDFVIHKIVAMYPLVPTGSYVMYPLNDFIDAIIWIQDHTNRNTVILSETTTGNYIPVYSGNTVYVGHQNTVNADEKMMYVRAFFGGVMPPSDAQKWLSQEKLNYIFFGPQEREDAGGKNLDEFFPFLTKIFENGNVIIYSPKY